MDPRDEVVASYLRGRARVEPPPELLGEISHAVSTAPQRQQRRSLFSILVPAGAGLAAAATLVALAALIGRLPDVGPSPGPSVSDPSIATPSLAPSPSPSGAPSADTLLVAGDTLTMPAVDASGEWGRVILRRGADSGGYEEGPGEGEPFQADPDAFYVELFIDYRADRLPEPAEFGVGDWHLRAEDGTRLDETVSVSSLPALAAFPGAVDVLSTPAQGWLVFVVPRSLEDVTLELVYQPAGLSTPAWTIPVREPGDPPEPVSPGGTPPAVSYVSRPGLPITVTESAEADDLFSQGDTCSNPVAGYTVEYPDSWYTNTEIGDVPACSWFSPVFYDVDDPAQVPEEVVIVMTYQTGVGAIGIPSQAVSAEDVPLPANDADRIEYIGVGGGFIPVDSLLYRYVVVIDGELEDPDPDASVLTPSTDWLPGEDLDTYLVNKAVLDRIMASLDISE